MNISKALLKSEIDELDEHYLELLYNIIRQFPRRSSASETQKETLRSHPAFAIDELCARHNVATGSDALAILRKNGFIGCLHGDGRLSQDYKQKLDWSHKL